MPRGHAIRTGRADARGSAVGQPAETGVGGAQPGTPAAGLGIWVAADWTVLIATAVLAYQVGGAAGIGLVGAARVLPGALLAGIASLAADRLSRPRMLVPRTASVRSVGPSRLRTIDRDAFMAAVTGHIGASRTAHSTAAQWLRADDTRDRADGGTGG